MAGVLEDAADILGTDLYMICDDTHGIWVMSASLLRLCYRQSHTITTLPRESSLPLQRP
jgi:hypothetical protein